MARTNMFERLNSSYSFRDEANRVNELVFVRGLLDDTDFYSIAYSLKKFVSEFCFADWINRKHYLDLEDFLKTVGYERIIQNSTKKLESFIDLIELAYNLYMMADLKIREQPDRFSYRSAFKLLKRILDDNLAQYNFTTYYDSWNETLIVVEKDPAVTAVVEIEEDSSLAFEIVQYNHHALKGDIAKKKTILFKLGAQLEPKRKELDRIDSRLSENIFTFLNNMNIRHNNIEPGNSKYKQCVADMKPEELESWYDELYQMILLAKLELDNVERMKKADELRKNF